MVLSEIKAKESFAKTNMRKSCGYMSVTKKVFLSFRGHLSTSLFTFKTSGKPLTDFITYHNLYNSQYFLNTVHQALCQLLGWVLGFGVFLHFLI